MPRKKLAENNAYSTDLKREKDINDNESHNRRKENNLFVKMKENKEKSKTSKPEESTKKSIQQKEKELNLEFERSAKKYDETYEQVKASGEWLLSQRQNAIVEIEKVEKLVNSIALHPKAFESDLNEIRIQKEQFNDTIEYGIEQRKVLEASAKSAGAGIAAGAAVASLAPSAAMWVATTFGTASTGTAISALSGAAATNAALAWLGGGALAAGGGGMAAGHALLALAGPIGWGIAGTTLALSVWLAWRKKHKIQEKKRDEIARMKNCIEALEEIKDQINAISIKTISIFEYLTKALNTYGYLSGHDYSSFSEEERQALGVLVNNTKALSSLLNETISG